MESILSPLVEIGTKAVMLAPANDAVAVGARVVHAVCATNVSVFAYGVCAKIGVDVTAMIKILQS